MKLTTFLLTVAFLNVSAAGLSQKVSFSGKNVPLVRVFEAVEKQTGYVFIYAKNTLENTHPVTLQVHEVPVEAFLQKLLADQPVKFTIDFQTILLARKPAPAQPVVRPDSFARAVQDTFLTVKGWVSSEKLEAIDGASVVVRETGKGTTADFQGQFELRNVRRHAVLVISAVGFEPTTIRATDQLYLHIPLKRAESKLDEVQIIAYGKTTTRYATGNVTRVSGEELRKLPPMNPILALQGRVAGLRITPNSAHPAAPVGMEIRGRNSLNKEFSGEPLIIIDGVPRTVLDVPSAIRYRIGTSSGLVQSGLSATEGQSLLYGLNAEDIESIDVLKDGDATAIYGSRGANGVVIITTRKPQAGNTRFSLQLDQGIKYIARFPRMIDRETYFRIRREALRNDGLVPTALNAPDLLLWDTSRYVNWQRELLQTGSDTRILASLEGGDLKNAFRLSASYHTLQPLHTLPGKDGTLNANFGFNHTSSNGKLHMGLNMEQRYTFTEAVKMANPSLAPNAPPILDSSSKPNFSAYGGLGAYPWASLFQPGITKVHTAAYSYNGGYQILEGLKVNVDMGYNQSFSTNNFFFPQKSIDPILVSFGLTGYAFFAETKAMNWLIDPTLNYSKHIGNGNLTLMAGTSIQRSSTATSTITATGYSLDELMESPANAAETMVNDDYAIYKYNAVFGRMHYNWQGKYIASVNVRRDGSSRFGPGRQFGNFGSVGLAWITSEETWWKKKMPAFINYFKLRGSYGISGNDQVGDYQYISQWSGQLDPLSRLYDYNGTRPFVPLHAVNQLFQWETVKKTELATDLELARRFTLSLSLYRMVCDDQLTRQPVPGYSGFSSVLTNSPAKVENRGLEGTVDAKLIQRNAFRWGATFNITANRNKLLAYPNLEKSRHALLYKIGRSLNTEYLFHYLGVNPLTGQYMLEDYNKDGVVSRGSAIPGDASNDAYVEWDLNPSFYGGMGTSVTRKGLSLSLLFSYAKQEVRDPRFYAQPGRLGAVHLPAEVIEQSWKKPGDRARYGPVSTLPNADILQSDGAIIDGSYIQLSNVAASWALPERLLKPARLSAASVSLKADNIFTLTRHKGTLNQGVTSLSEMIPRTIAFSLRFTF